MNIELDTFAQSAREKIVDYARAIESAQGIEQRLELALQAAGYALAGLERLARIIEQVSIEDQRGENE